MDEQALAQVIGAQAPEPADQEFRSMARHEQRRLLVSLIEQGRSDEEIGRMFGMSQWQVRNLRYKLGIKKDRGGNVYLETSERQPATRPFAGELAGVVADPSRTTDRPFTLTLHGTFPGGQLSRRLEGLRAFLEAADPARRYRVRLELLERGEAREPESEEDAGHQQPGATPAAGTP